MPPRAATAVETAEAAEGRVFHTGCVITISAGHAVHDTYSAFLAPLLPAFKANLLLSNTEAGLLSVFLQLPSLLQPVIGHMGDRMDLRALVILAPAIGGITMSLLGVAPSYAALVALLLADGLMSAGLHAVGPVLAGRVSGRSLGRGMGIWMVGGELGRTLGPLVIVTAVERVGLEGTPWLMMPGLLASVLIYGGLKAARACLGGAIAISPSRQALRGMAFFLIPLTAILLVRSLMVGALTTYLPLFLSEEGATLWRAGASLTVLQAAAVVGAMLGGALSDRLGRRLLILVSLIVTPALMLAFLGAKGWLQFLLLPVLGLTALSPIAVIMALVQESFPQSRSLANGVYMALQFLIQSFALLVLGILGDWFGLRTAFVVSAIAPLLGLPFLFMFPRGPSVRA